MLRLEICVDVIDGTTHEGKRKTRKSLTLSKLWSSARHLQHIVPNCRLERRTRRALAPSNNDEIWMWNCRWQFLKMAVREHQGHCGQQWPLLLLTRPLRRSTTVTRSTWPRSSTCWRSCCPSSSGDSTQACPDPPRHPALNSTRPNWVATVGNIGRCRPSAATRCNPHPKWTSAGWPKKPSAVAPFVIARRSHYRRTAYRWSRWRATTGPDVQRPVTFALVSNIHKILL